MLPVRVNYSPSSGLIITLAALSGRCSAITARQRVVAGISESFNKRYRLAHRDFTVRFSLRRLVCLTGSARDGGLSFKYWITLDW